MSNLHQGAGRREEGGEKRGEGGNSKELLSLKSFSAGLPIFSHRRETSIPAVYLFSWKSRVC